MPGRKKPVAARPLKSVAPVPPEEIKRLVEQVLDDAKAEDIVAISLEGKLTVADYMVVATGRSHRQVAGFAERLVDALKGIGAPVLSVEGLQASDWVLVDAGDVIVHLFRPEIRTLYALEKMWSVDLTARRARRGESGA